MTLPARIGPFRLIAELGKGGFAPVWVASEEYGGTEVRSVALKIFHEHDLRDAPGTDGAARSARDRIVEEARALCRVEHPNVVRFFQIVEDEERGLLGLAMEHLRGRSLAARIDQEGPLAVDDALAVGAAIASALAAVHAVGLVHRDVKPDNVLDTGTAHKLIDFGIAARARPPGAYARSERAVTVRPVASADAHGVTTHRDVVDTGDGPQVVEIENATVPIAEADDPEHGLAGTMGYVDPECLARGERATPASDLYSLGATLYECLTGIVPAAEGPGAASGKIRLAVALGAAPPPPLRSLAPHVPEPVAALVEALLRPTRDARPKSADAVACELDRLRRLARGRTRRLPEDGPFRGLGAFEARHRDLYFGRAIDVASALEALRVRGGLALVGASGSGKSSLARAGVLPAIEDGALGAWPTRWAVCALAPGRAPMAALAAALRPALEDAPLPDEPDAIADDLAARVERTGTGVVVSVDALEELVTVSDPTQAERLGRVVAALASRASAGVRVVVTARRDLLDPLLALPGLGPALARAVQLVAPLSASAWIEALTERLAAYGYALEDPQMTDDLARELAGAAHAMPLVEFALARLWDARDEARRVVPRAALARMGGLSGALARYADATIAAIAARHGPRAADVADRVLEVLTTVHGTRATRTAAEIAALVPDPTCRDVLAALEAARLVVAVDDGLTIAHDALVERWPRLRAFLDARRRDREIARDVEAAAARWGSSRDRDHLLRGRPLRDARVVAKTGSVPLGDGARAFLAASWRADLRNRAGVVILAGSVVLGAAAVLAAYLHAEAATAAEKRSAMETTKELLDARNRPESQRAAEIAALVAAKHACEKELAKRSASCAADADGGSVP